MTAKRDPLGPIDDRELEFLQTVAAFGSRHPSMAAVAREFGFTRQWASKRVKHLREKGMIEEVDPGERTWGVFLTHNAKLLLERSMGAGMR